jgi:hypothetical protein
MNATPSHPEWWNPEQALSILKTRLENGFEVVSRPGDDRLSSRTLSVVHYDWQPTGDNWTVTTVIRLGFRESMTLVRTFSTHDVEQAFARASESYHEGRYYRLGSHLSVPNCGSNGLLDLNCSIEVTDEISQYVTELLGRYGTRMALYRSNPVGAVA